MFCYYILFPIDQQSVENGVVLDKKGIEVPNPLELPEDDNSEEVKKFEENANKILQK